MSATVQPLRPAPVRPAERQRLADAVEKLVGVDKEVARLREAQEKVGSIGRAIIHREELEEKLAEARSGEADWTVKVLLGEAKGTGPLVALVEQVAEAKAEEERRRDVHQILNRRIDAAEADRRFAAGNVQAAVIAVIASSTEVAALLARHGEQSRELIATEMMINAVGVAVPFRGRPVAENGRLPQIAAWRAAYAALASDPDAALPAVDTPPAPPAAA
jgi:hypothetical protein